MPIDFLIVRASDVVENVFSEESTSVAGITGSDILWNAGLRKDSGEEIPVELFDVNTKPSSLFIGITQRLNNKIQNEFGKQAVLKDLEGNMLITKFPNIANEVLRDKQIKEVTVFSRAGKTETMQFNFPRCNGIIDVISSGKTLDANDWLVLERFHDVTIRMIEAADKMSTTDRAILDDLRERIYLAKLRRGMI
jgi:ATP phosphoribosyltransferase